jgi:GxxExxY protein
MQKIIFKEESYKIIGACFEVYKQKGSGFTEPIYQECLKIELELRGIPFISQPILELEYKGTVLTQSFRPDFVCFDKIILEIKAVQSIVDAHRAQVLNYLHSIGKDLALLINFGGYPRLEHERIIGPNANAQTRSVADEIASWDLNRA